MAPTFLFIGTGTLLGVWGPALAALGLTVTAPRAVNGNQGLVMGLVLAGATLLVREPVFPPWPPVGPMGRLPFAVVAAALMAHGAGRTGRPWLAGYVMLFGPPLLGVGVIVGPGLDLPFKQLLGAGFAALSLIVAHRLQADRDDAGALPLGLFASAAGLGLLGLVYPTVLWLHGFGVLATAVAVWGGARLRGEAFGTAPAMVAQVAVTGIGAGYALATPALGPSVGLILLMPWMRVPAVLLAAGTVRRGLIQATLMAGLTAVALDLAATLP